MFTEKNYPKSWGSIKKGDYRLRRWANKPEKEMEKLESKLWELVAKMAASKKAKKKFKTHCFVAAGWEWSVFRKDEGTVIKVPAGIFAEVGDKRYLGNSRFAYKKILEYFPQKHVAKSTFRREEGLNLIEQEYVEGRLSNMIGYNTRNKKLRSNLRVFLENCLRILADYEWLPDLDIKRTRRGFKLGNVIIEEETLTPKIIDFTAYYDVYRLYPQRKEFELSDKRRRIKDFLNWLAD